MSGHPQQQLVRDELAKIAIENGADDPLDIEMEPDREEYRKALPLTAVADFISDGGTLNQLVTIISERVGFPVHRKTLARSIDKIPGAAEVLRSAREEGAAALVDQAREIVDNAPETREGIAKAQARSEIRRWTAEKFAPAQFGNSRNVNVSMSLATLHLDSLRRVPRLPEAAVEQLADPAIQDAVVEEIVDAE